MILHSCWQAPDGRKALVLINWDTEEASWRWEGLEGTLPPRSCHLIPLKKSCATSHADMEFLRKTASFSGIPQNSCKNKA